MFWGLQLLNRLEEIATRSPQLQGDAESGDEEADRRNVCRHEQTDPQLITGGSATLLVLRDNRNVRGGEIVACHFFGFNPRERDMLVGRRFGRLRRELADERQHLDNDGFVIVKKSWKRAANYDLAAELFLYFTHHCGGGRLAGFDFAAGKFPLKREVFVGRALRQQQAPIPLDQGANDGNRNGRRHRSLLNNAASDCATFLPLRGFPCMKTVVKVLLVIAVLLVAIKLSPIVFLLALLGLLAATFLGAIGLSMLAVFAAVVLTLAVALSPIWIPVLVIVGLVSLFKKANRPPQSPSLAA